MGRPDGQMDGQGRVGKVGKVRKVLQDAIWERGHALTGSAGRGLPGCKVEEGELDGMGDGQEEGT